MLLLPPPVLPLAPAALRLRACPAAGAPAVVHACAAGAARQRRRQRASVTGAVQRGASLHAQSEDRTAATEADDEEDDEEGYDGGASVPRSVTVTAVGPGRRLTRFPLFATRKRTTAAPLSRLKPEPVASALLRGERRRRGCGRGGRLRGRVRVPSVPTNFQPVEVRRGPLQGAHARRPPGRSETHKSPSGMLVVADPPLCVYPEGPRGWGGGAGDRALAAAAARAACAAKTAEGVPVVARAEGAVGGGASPGRR